MAYFIKKSNKPLEAKQLTETNRDEILDWLAGMGSKGLDGSIKLKTPESDGETQTAKTWNWIFKGYTDELGWHYWPVDDSYVKENYEEVQKPSIYGK